MNIDDNKASYAQQTTFKLCNFIFKYILRIKWPNGSALITMPVQIKKA